MTKVRGWRCALMLGTILSLVAAPGLLAQAPTGNLYGTVSDNDGELLPGVTVTLTGLGPERTQITDARGQFRFLGLDPGDTYELKAQLEGFRLDRVPERRRAAQPQHDGAAGLDPCGRRDHHSHI